MGRNPTLGWIWSMRYWDGYFPNDNASRNPTLGWIWSMRLF